jgi:RNA polymerase sigma-70 factor (ECF subfamily)
VKGTDPSADVDIDLVRRARTGDTAAFGNLFDRHHRAVFRAALAALGSEAEADDVTQEAFVTAYRKLDTFRGDASFKTWLLTIAWRKALDRRASLTRWLRMTMSEAGFSNETIDPIEAVRSNDRSAEETLAADELQRHIRRLIGTLPRKLRDALLLAGSGEHSYEQIAHMLGVPVGTVKWRVSEARRVLRRKLGAIGYGYD